MPRFCFFSAVSHFSLVVFSDELLFIRFVYDILQSHALLTGFQYMVVLLYPQIKLLFGLEILIMCQSRATCLLADCCFKELAL